MEVKVKLRKITVKDDETGEEFTVKTVRTAEQVVADTEATEKEAVRETVDDAVWAAYQEE